MKRVRLIAAMVLGMSAAACSSVDTASRNAPYETVPAQAVAPAPSFQLAGMNVVVPTTLKVSERNSYYPGGDIVWRGDAYGNRYEQVKSIFEDAVVLGGTQVQGEIPVNVNIELKRFHALTEKTRYSVGGVHAIEFVMIITDPVTGAVLRGPKEIKASLVGYGGEKALQAEARGLTQKYRITQHLARVVMDEMTKPQGFVAPKGGVTAQVVPLGPVKPL
ncbi:DUF6778 family protein [Shimia haliotis]|uniref:Lipoprotein n=1 Tax=Shimia haliotis TaxID=1280847 RepID=A0A1I4AKM5_9RHOB|nr:DUF6778 family protein [Shimia haliotis]SFK56914.1 hypothetical protein SAMN04488036_101440 [Shimia haliotis]